MSENGLVTVTVDERTVQVPKGTGLVETAQAAGIEIPVFCYEPRLGPPVGACRMCLVEVEGMPKLQAGCTLTAQDGMVVRTAATSPMAAEGQEATLELILVNHPLDCPVCDKGGECPLQDLTFRYGPGTTRMRFAKLTVEKPIPLSPLVALDRERCILCYRCTRFSEEVAEDGLLIARNRGAHTEIATFEDEPYRSPFSGNVIELCPVGALTSTLYRFDARPWEIQNVPTVCTGCAVGCNVSATIREGKVRRILSRNHPEIDRGWLCDKGRFSYPSLRAADRISVPLRRGPRGLEEVSWEVALDTAEELLRESRGAIVTALSGSETTELAYALGKLLRRGLDAHSAVLPEATSSALDAFRLPLSAIAEAELVVVVGDDPVVERAPIVDLWMKEARRRGAEIVVCSPVGDVQVAPGHAAEWCRELAEPGSELGARIRSAERAILIWSGPGGGGGARLAELAYALGLHERPGSGAFHLPATPNGRGVAAAWSAAADVDETNPEPIKLLVVSGDEAAADPSVRALAEQSERTLVIAMFHGLAGGWADLVLPATGALEREGTVMNLEGRVQRLRRAAMPPCPDELTWIAELAGRFGVELSPHPAVVYEEAASILYRDLSLAAIGLRAGLPGRAPYEAPAPATTKAPMVEPSRRDERFVGELRLQRVRTLFSGPAVERVPELAFQRAPAEIELSPAEAERRGVTTGDRVHVRSNGISVELRARVNRKLVDGVARIADEHAGDLHAAVEVVRA
ncbi:MAG: 2Fe-2S iron-sulfur cluster-binding protein [Thermoleophilia bacterium]|nr:2Fe-2S iron-sulfur cluster-binding protein [Gaiellaceae bacterium]MDW8337914.1 2Fe-2S iron-sulfur cluster-binding protein [Thermoleophilia bacterium]